jgi:hypothetical protein
MHSIQLASESKSFLIFSHQIPSEYSVYQHNQPFSPGKYYFSRNESRNLLLKKKFLI